MLATSRISSQTKQESDIRGGGWRGGYKFGSKENERDNEGALWSKIGLEDVAVNYMSSLADGNE